MRSVADEITSIPLHNQIPCAFFPSHLPPPPYPCYPAFTLCIQLKLNIFWRGKIIELKLRVVTDW